MNGLAQIPYWLPPGIFLLSAALVAFLARPAQRLGWVDLPGSRKHHRDPVPLVGGVALWVAFSVGVLLLPTKPAEYPVLLAAVTLVTLVGLYDDLRPTPPTVRFLFQAAAVLLMGLTQDTRITNLGDIFGIGHIDVGWATSLLTLVAVIGAVNAFNLIDGLDGLAGGLALVATGWLLVLCLRAPVLSPGRVGALLVLLMAIAGFLVHNMRHPWRARARVFMGDAGSTMLGFVLAWFLIRNSQCQPTGMEPVTALWIVALPLMDTVAVTLRRIGSRRSPFVADRQHLHHLLLDYGLSDGRAVALLLLIAGGLGGLGVLAQWLQVPEHLRFYAFLGVLLLHYSITGRMARQCPAAAPRPAGW